MCIQETIHTRRRKNQQPLLEGLPYERRKRRPFCERSLSPEVTPPETVEPNLEEMANQPPPRCTLGDTTNIVGPLNFNSIAVSIDNTISMVMSPTLIQLVQNNQFHGLSNENPYKHLTIFGEICNTVKFTKDWLNSFPEGTFRTWEAAVQEFVTKFSPPSKINQGKLEIS